MFITGPCNGGLAFLTGPNGVFSTKGTYYENNERCNWRIEVDKRKVRTCQYLCEVLFLFHMKIVSIDLMILFRCAKLNSYCGRQTHVCISTHIV